MYKNKERERERERDIANNCMYIYEFHCVAFKISKETCGNVRLLGLVIASHGSFRSVAAAIWLEFIVCVRKGLPVVGICLILSSPSLFLSLSFYIYIYIYFFFIFIYSYMHISGMRRSSLVQSGPEKQTCQKLRSNPVQTIIQPKESVQSGPQ